MIDLIRRYLESKIETRYNMAESQELYAYVEIGKLGHKIGDEALVGRAVEKIMEIIGNY